MFKRRSSTDDLREKFIERALSETGYTARANGTSYYGERVGYTGIGLPWDGAFIDVVAREVGLPLQAHVYTASALGEYVRTARLYRKPQRGDVVFFNFSADAATAFNGPHVGIVVDASRWDTQRIIETVEGNSSSGLPKGAQLNDGVYKRVRHSTDVLGFGRPNFKAARHGSEPINATVHVNAARVRGTKPCRDIETVQLALAQLTDVKDMQRGTWCPRTRAAFANFQRSIGYVGPKADGNPDTAALTRLGVETQLFMVEGN
jgi:hypothetical protein